MAGRIGFEGSEARSCSSSRFFSARFSRAALRLASSASALEVPLAPLDHSWASLRSASSAALFAFASAVAAFYNISFLYAAMAPWRCQQPFWCFRQIFWAW